MSELITWQEALHAIADGKEVEYSFVGDWFSVDSKTELSIFHRSDVVFRLKPQTIMIGDVEVPAPFEPKEGDLTWCISDYHNCGYYKDIWEIDYSVVIGAWRTEEEIKQVVAALRKLFKGQI